MKENTKCTKCGNKKWKEKYKDNFICQKCRQKEEREKMLTQKNN